MPQLNIKRNLVAFSIFILTATSGLAQADDTEIYFSSGSSVGNTSNVILPNVLLILDTSGSMTATVSGTGKSRMELMKEAMREIIGNVQDVNMGLMRFTYQDGGSVSFPIRYIDEAAANTVSEPDDTVRTLNYSVIASADDAEENNGTTAVTTNDGVLNINFLPPGGTATVQIDASDDDAAEFSGNTYTDWRIYSDARVLNGMRFPGLSLPTDADVTNATITLYEYNSIDAADSGTFSGEAVTNCLDYSSPSNTELSTRKSANETTASVAAGPYSSAVDPTNIDITTVVEELVESGNGIGAGTGGNPLCLFYQGDTFDADAFESFDTNAGQAPTLSVTYTSGAGGVQQTTGIRFQNVVVPQGATITDAKLILTPNGSDSDTTEQILIKAEAVDDAAAYTTTNADISGRTTGAKTLTWTLPATTADTPITSCVDGTCTGPSLASVIEDVTGRANWCGGNSLNLIIEYDATNNGGKNFYSYDGNSGLAPELEITYDTTGSLGCVVDTETAQIAAGTDDAENSSTGSADLDFDDGITVGLRFREIDIPQGAEILDARLSFTAYANDSGSTDITIYGEDEDDTNTYGNVTSRTKTTASVLWNPPTFSTNSVYTTPNLKDVVKEIITDRTGWTSGNSLAFILETTGNDRQARTYNNSTTKAPRLSITYRTTASFSPVKTVRERLIEIVDDYPTSDWTPITEVMYEAAKYWRGEDVVYGTSRDGLRETRLSHPGSYCNDDNDCNGADVANHPPYGVDNPSGCPEDNLDDYDCRNRRIDGSPTYISPFDSELSCAANYQVLLTDGEANSASMESTIESEFGSEDFGVDVDADGDGDGQCRTTNTAGGSISTAQKCAIDLTEFMYKNDQSSALDNDQTVKTFTVGFNFSAQYLEDMATEAGGDFFEATTASDLVTVFDTILAEVKSSPTSFVAPSLATNAFNRLLSRDEVYFGLFTPELNASWDGNVKKYEVCIESDPDGDGTEDCTLGSILDQSGGLAIDEVTNRFKETAQSFWSDAIDGLTTVSGGTGAEFDDYTDRIIYTETTSTGIAPSSGTLLNTTGFKITSSNWDDASLATVRNAVCPTPSTTGGSECEDRMLWMLGKVILAEETDVDADTRWTVNDVLHSSPSIITYGGADSDADGVIDVFYDKLVYGSNDGSLHFVNASDGSGKEEWSFMPQSMINQQQAIYEDAEGNHLYGMDITPVIYQKDSDGDGSIETGDGDFVKIIAAMRRGGNFIYSLDVSANIASVGQTVVPKFLWRIEGGVGDYQYLAQTWSRPELGKIKTSSGTQDVMVFGGGYDTALDSDFGTDATGGSDNNGNMIFIADPTDGSLIFSIGGSSTNADIKVAEMKYSIPSRVTLLDSDGDGIDDRIYVGDTGGQIWRVDLASDVNPVAAAPEGSSVVGRLAAISTQGTEAEERRFFEPPSVVQVKDTLYADAANSEYDYVLIGSGNRANPLNNVTKDRFYAFRDYTIGTMTGGSGASANLAQDYPRTGSSPISHATATDLVDVTTSVLDASSSTVDNSFGWYFDFFSANANEAGEKVLSAPLTIAGTVLFTTYAPDQANNLDSCAANVGGGNAYNFDILSTRATLDWDADGTVENVADRKQTLGGGIPSDVVPIFTKEGIVGIVGVEGGASQLGTLAGLPRFRTYWYEEG